MNDKLFTLINDETLFESRYHDALKKILEDIQGTGARYVVALARKGPRLFDICKRGPLQKHLRGLEVLTDRSLSFLPHGFFQGQDVPVIDDIAIYGSTLKYVCQLVSACGGNPIPYAIAINTFQLNTELVRPRYALGLTFKQASTFNNALARAMGRLCKPFDLDYPIATAPLRIEPKQLICEIEKLISPNAVWQVGGAADDVRSISIDLTENAFRPSFLNMLGISETDISKIRFYFDTNVVRIVPMHVFEWAPDRAGLVEQATAGVDNPYGDLLQNILNREFCNHDPEIDCISYRTYVLAYFLCGLHVLGRAWEKLSLGNILHIDLSELSWSFEDLVYLFGPVVGKQVFDKMPELLTWSSMDSTGAKDVAYSCSSTDKVYELVQQRLKRNVLVQKSLEPFKAISPVDRTSTELIGELLNITYVEHERIERAFRKDRRRRLSVGFSVGELRCLLNSKKTLTQYELSEAIDELVDNGAAVPQFIFEAPHDNEPGRWLRAYRYGENGYGTKAKKTQYFVACLVLELQKQIPRYSKRRKWVSEFMLEKIASAVFLSGLRHHPDMRDLQLKRVIDEFGARVEPNTDGQRQTLANWGENIGLFELARKSNRTEISISGKWIRRNPLQNSPLDDRHLLPDLSGFVQACLAFIGTDILFTPGGNRSRRLSFPPKCQKTLVQQAGFSPGKSKTQRNHGRNAGKSVSFPSSGQKRRSAPICLGS